MNLLNYALGNVGRTVRFGPNSTLARASRYADVLALTKAMAQGEIAVLIVKDANPAFTLPARAAFAEALAKVPFVVSLSSHMDETTARAHLVIPDLTPLESWGDHSPREGVWGLLQPAMAPVPKVGPTNPDALDLPQLQAVRDALGRRAPETFPGVETKSAGDLLLEAGRALVPGSEKTVFQAKTFADYLRDSWRAMAKTVAPKAAFDEFWEDALRRGGYWADVPAAKVALRAGREGVGPGAGSRGRRNRSRPPGRSVLPLLRRSRRQQGVAPRGARSHDPGGLRQLGRGPGGDRAKPRRPVRGRAAGGIASRLASRPRHTSRKRWPAGAVAIPTGLGHTAYGRFARGVGQSPYALLPAEPTAGSGGRRWLGVRVRLQKTGRRDKLASPAGVTEIDHSREIFETVGLAEAVKLERGGKAPEHANLPSMYPDLKYPQNRWGMSIDLDACTGCQACVVACQAENNVPSVGKADIDYGRSIQWLRVERWWDRGHGEAKTPRGTRPAPSLVGVAHAAEAPSTGRPGARFLPMLCQHCEVAPCEPVCPVFAAYHTTDGLNAQVYNRCVGTRYCGNNCPYMVRRFNWYRYEWPAPMNLQLNPDVAVRDRGIMEKCTMCVQRIIAGRDRARDEGRQPRDGEIQTACQQTCPTQAITFGDLKDGQSRVSRLSTSPRGLPRPRRAGDAPGGDVPEEDPPGGARVSAPSGTEQPDAADLGRRRPDLRRRQPGRPPDAPSSRVDLLRLDVPRRPHPGRRHLLLAPPGLLRHGDGWEAQPPDVGDVHHHVRVLDRHRPRGDADLRDPVPVPGQVAHVDLPRLGGDDHLRRHDGGPVPGHPRRPHVVRVLAAPVPERAVPVAELPLAARLGRVRDLDVPDHQHRVLHRRASCRTSPRCGTPPPAGSGRIYALLSMGWQGTDRQWRHYRRAYGLFAALATPLVVSVHSVVSWDFAMALVPGWHSTLFAPFFVDGAIFSGFAMVLVLLIPMRRFFNLYAYITDRHLDNMAKLILVTGLVLTYFYACEGFTAWYSGEHDGAGLVPLQVGRGLRAVVVAPDLLQQRGAPGLLLEARADAPAHALRRVDPRADRHVVRALQHHRAGPGARVLPVHLRHLRPDAGDSGIIIGSFAWFFILFLGFIKVMPSMSIVEVKETIPHPVRDGHAH